MVKRALVFVFIIAIAAGSFWWYQRNSTQATPASASPTPTVNQKTFVLEVKNKTLVSGPEVLQANEGDIVTIKITSDQAEELHLHGYDQSVDLEPNKEAELVITANLTGRFVYELEKSKTDIGALEVQPK